MDLAPTVHAAAQAVALWAGLSLILLLALSVRVVRLRRRHHVALGHGEIADLHHAVRAFANAAEYLPAGLGALTILALVGAPPLLVHLVGAMLFGGRLAHAIGLSRSGGASLARAGGMVATWLAFIVAAVALLFYAVP